MLARGALLRVSGELGWIKLAKRERDERQAVVDALLPFGRLETRCRRR
jgi:hypothetical protein